MLSCQQWLIYEILLIPTYTLRYPNWNNNVICWQEKDIYNTWAEKRAFSNWGKIALQSCIISCCTTKWISHMYTYMPSLLSLPPTNPCPTHLGYHWATSWTPWAIQQDPTRSPFHTRHTDASPNERFHQWHAAEARGETRNITDYSRSRSKVQWGAASHRSGKDYHSKGCRGCGAFFDSWIC